MNEHQSAGSTDPKDIEMKRHYVTFLSPGTFVAEDTTKQVDPQRPKGSNTSRQHAWQRLQARDRNHEGLALDSTAQ